MASTTSTSSKSKYYDVPKLHEEQGEVLTWRQNLITAAQALGIAKYFGTKPEEYDDLTSSEKEKYAFLTQMILHSLGDSVRRHADTFVQNELNKEGVPDYEAPPVNPTRLYEEIKRFFMPTTAAALQNLWSRLTNRQLSEGETWRDFFADLESLKKAINDQMDLQDVLVDPPNVIPCRIPAKVMKLYCVPDRPKPPRGISSSSLGEGSERDVKQEESESDGEDEPCLEAPEPSLGAPTSTRVASTSLKTVDLVPVDIEGKQYYAVVDVELTLISNLRSSSQRDKHLSNLAAAGLVKKGKVTDANLLPIVLKELRVQNELTYTHLASKKSLDYDFVKKYTIDHCSGVTDDESLGYVGPELDKRRQGETSYPRGRQRNRGCDQRRKTKSSNSGEPKPILKTSDSGSQKGKGSSTSNTKRPQYAKGKQQKKKEVFFAYLREEQCFGVSSNTVLVDSGCTRHMIGRNHQKFITRRRRIPPRSVLLPDGSSREATETVTARYPLANGKFLVVNDALYVEEFQGSFLSLGQMTRRKGMSILFEGKKMVIRTKGRGFSHLITEAERCKDNLYLLPLASLKQRHLMESIRIFANGDRGELVEVVGCAEDDTAPEPTKEQQAHDLHCRMGHPNISVLRKMIKEQSIAGLPDNAEELLKNFRHCELCTQGKQKRRRRKGKRRPTPLFGYLFVDSSPGHPKLPGGQTGFQVIVDDYSKYRYINLYKLKTENPDVIVNRVKILKARGIDVTVVVTDNAGEYGENLKKRLNELGVELKHSAPHCQWQNGVAERSIGLVKDLVRVLLLEADLPAKRYWGFAARHAVWILNNTPTKALNDRSPHEILTGCRPDARMFHRFGSSCYRHTNKKKNSQFGPKSELCRFLHVSDSTTGYVVERVSDKRIFTTSEVSFPADRPRTTEAGPSSHVTTGETSSTSNSSPASVREGNQSDEVGEVKDLEFGRPCPVDCQLCNPSKKYKYEIPKTTYKNRYPLSPNPPITVDMAPRPPYGSRFAPSEWFERLHRNYSNASTPSTSEEATTDNNEPAASNPPISDDVPPPELSEVEPEVESGEGPRLDSGVIELYPSSEEESDLGEESELEVLFTDTEPEDSDEEYNSDGGGPSSVSSSSPPDPEDSPSSPQLGTNPNFGMEKLKQYEYGGGGPSTFYKDVSAISGKRRIKPKIAAVREPKSYRAAKNDPDHGPQWAEAADKEFNALMDNNTWDYVDIDEVPEGVSIHRPIWRWKHKLDGRFKGRLCFDGRHQTYGEDVWGKTSPVPPFEIVRVVLSLLLQHSKRIVQADIPNAFLHPVVDAPVYMYQPEGYRRGDKVCKLNKGLYGLQQASKLWYEDLVEVLKKFGLTESEYCRCVFVRKEYWGWMLVIIYVDDLIIGTDSDILVDRLVDILRQKFGIRFEENVDTYLGMKCQKVGDQLFMSQQHLIHTLIEKTGVSNKRIAKTPSNPKTHLEEEGTPFEDNKLYRSVVGILLWLARCTRPDVMFQTIALAQFQTKPTSVQWGAAQHLVRYLKGTPSLGVTLNLSNEPLFTAFFDAGHQNPALHMRSSTGFLILFGGSPIAWSSSIQRSICLSSAESEYMAISQGMRSVLWLQHFIHEMSDKLGFEKHSRALCFTDSKPAIDIIIKKDPSMPAVKHLLARVHWMMDVFNSDEADLLHVPSQDNLADIFTKSFSSAPLFESLRDRVLSSPPDAGEC